MRPTTSRKIDRPWRWLWRTGQGLGHRLWPNRRAVWRVVVPLAFSVGVHAALAACITGLALLLTEPARAPGGDVMISFDDPAVVQAPDDPVHRVEEPVPNVASILAGGDGPRSVTEPPRLTGLSGGEAPAIPELRSGGGGSAGEVMSALRAREPDVSIGASFAGLGADRASRIVYVVDASGAMVTSLGLVVQELERSIGRLGSSQRFQVILYRDRRHGQDGGDVLLYEVYGADSARRARLLDATAINKARVGEWLRSVSPEGRSNPLDGLRAAMTLDPDVVFLLARSIPRSGGEGTAGVWGLGLKQTLEELNSLNPTEARTGKRRASIKTIQFLEEDPTGVMQAIGREHGGGEGSYRVLTLEDLRGK